MKWDFPFSLFFLLIALPFSLFFCGYFFVCNVCLMTFLGRWRSGSVCGSGRLKGSGRSAETGMIRDCLVILEGLRYRLLDHCLLFLEEWASCLSSIDGLILDWVILLFCSLSFIPFFGFVDSFFGFSIIDPPQETVGDINSSLDSQVIRLTVTVFSSSTGRLSVVPW